MNILESNEPKRKRIHAQHRNHKLMAYQENRKKATNLYLSTAGNRKLSEECGFKCAFLHSRYVDMAEETNEELTDEFMAGITGWAVRTVGNYRRKLEKAFWFKKETIKNASGKLGATYYFLDQKVISEYMDDVEYEYFEDYLKNKPNLSLVVS